MPTSVDHETRKLPKRLDKIPDNFLPLLKKPKGEIFPSNVAKSFREVNTFHGQYEINLGDLRFVSKALLPLRSFCHP